MFGHIYDSDIKFLYSYDFQAYKTYFIILSDCYLWGEFTSSVTAWKHQWMDDIEVQITRAYVNSAAYTESQD